MGRSRVRFVQPGPRALLVRALRAGRARRRLVSAPTLALIRVQQFERGGVLIGEIQDDGQIETVWSTEGTVAGDAWSDFLPSSKDLISDWTAPIKCGNYNTKTKKCLAK